MIISHKNTGFREYELSLIDETEYIPVSKWFPPPDPFKLEGNEVHVWAAGLDVKASSLQRFLQNLSADEYERAQKFSFRKGREHFIVGRGLARVILGRYLDIEPRDLRFLYGPHGKPGLENKVPGDELFFNMSHSNGLLLCAVTRSREIGIDLEYIRHEISPEQISERYFSTQEAEYLRAFPKHARERAFFTLWVRKEAYIKATGKGFSLPLDEFVVSPFSEEQVRFPKSPKNHHKTCNWSMRNLDVGPDYAAAIVVQGKCRKLGCYQWIEEML